MSFFYDGALPKANLLSQMASCWTKTYSITNYLKRECDHQARIISEVDDYRKPILKKEEIEMNVKEEIHVAHCIPLP